MRGSNWKTVSTLVTMVVVAGCQEGAVTAPVSQSLAPTSILNAPEGRPDISFGTMAASNGSSNGSSGNVTADFTVTPNGGTFTVGNNVIYFPAKSICEPSSSGYGPSTWDKGCSPAKGSIKIHAVVRTAKLGTWIDFSPALRFVPSSSASEWVWLYMSNPAVRGASDFSKFNINYSARIGDLGVDESATDATMRTYIDAFSGVTLRRIKHFSGYQNSSGRSCNPDLEPDCYPVDDGT